MTAGKKYPYYTGLRWFRILVIFGFVTNMLLFALPAIFAPRLVESWFDVGTTNTIHWLQNVGILLAIISIMYLPAIRDPFRYLFIAFLLVAGRFSAGCLFLVGVLYIGYPAGMMTLALNDLILSSIQAVALYFMLRDGDPRAAGAA